MSSKFAWNSGFGFEIAGFTFPDPLGSGRICGACPRVSIAIVNLLFRPVSSVFLLRIFNERGGRYADLGIPNFAGGVGSSGRGQYDDIDQTTTQSVPKTGIDTGSPGHGYSAGGDGLPPYSQP
ncbi:hypothetical protein HPB50_018680 [Hyalomma asiaticum]|uniref:Uncharacterized protein n=1 Tax=Hyalomma asiaticum TaxID=266040 RepID=A0ACB7SIZ9_HYAAI|nr:hypothetical protein HPB50_018680 [Hyalomma asiaticum]